jgi:biotin transporter BioY
MKSAVEERICGVRACVRDEARRETVAMVCGCCVVLCCGVLWMRNSAGEVFRNWGSWKRCPGTPKQPASQRPFR